MIHYDLRGIVFKLSIVVIAILGLSIGGTITSQTHVSAHSINRIHRYGYQKAQRRHTKGVHAKRTKRVQKSNSRTTKHRRNNQNQNSQIPTKVEHRETSRDPIAIGPKNSKKK